MYERKTVSAKSIALITVSALTVIVAGCGPKEEPAAAPSAPSVQSSPSGTTGGLSSDNGRTAPQQVAPEAPKLAPVTQ